MSRYMWLYIHSWASLVQGSGLYKTRSKSDMPCNVSWTVARGWKRQFLGSNVQIRYEIFSTLHVLYAAASKNLDFWYFVFSNNEPSTFSDPNMTGLIRKLLGCCEDASHCDCHFNVVGRTLIGLIGKEGLIGLVRKLKGCCEDASHCECP